MILPPGKNCLTIVRSGSYLNNTLVLLERSYVWTVSASIRIKDLLPDESGKLVKGLTKIKIGGQTRNPHRGRSGFEVSDPELAGRRTNVMPPFLHWQKTLPQGTILRAIPC